MRGSGWGRSGLRCEGLVELVGDGGETDRGRWRLGSRLLRQRGSRRPSRSLRLGSDHRGSVRTVSSSSLEEGEETNVFDGSPERSVRVHRVQLVSKGVGSGGEKSDLGICACGREVQRLGMESECPGLGCNTRISSPAFASKQHAHLVQAPCVPRQLRPS